MEVRVFLGRNREAMDGRKKSSERWLRKRISYVQCFQGFGEAAAGSYSLTKKRLRPNPPQSCSWRRSAGSYSLTKKRLRLRSKFRASSSPIVRRKLFADEEAIETGYCLADNFGDRTPEAIR